MWVSVLCLRKCIVSVGRISQQLKNMSHKQGQSLKIENLSTKYLLDMAVNPIFQLQKVMKRKSNPGSETSPIGKPLVCLRDPASKE